jgi:hypothetical protein
MYLVPQHRGTKVGEPLRGEAKGKVVRLWRLHFHERIDAILRQVRSHGTGLIPLSGPVLPLRFLLPVLCASTGMLSAIL